MTSIEGFRYALVGVYTLNSGKALIYAMGLKGKTAQEVGTSGPKGKGKTQRGQAKGGGKDSEKPSSESGVKKLRSGEFLEDSPGVQKGPSTAISWQQPDLGSTEKESSKKPRRKSRLQGKGLAWRPATT